jgi:hypothetical protein
MDTSDLPTAGELIAALLEVLEQLPADEPVTCWTTPEVTAAELPELERAEQAVR